MGFTNKVVPFDVEALKYVQYQAKVGNAIDESDVYLLYRTEPKRSVLMELIRVWASCGKLTEELLAPLYEWPNGEVAVALFLLDRYVSSELADFCRGGSASC